MPDRVSGLTALHCFPRKEDRVSFLVLPGPQTFSLESGTSVSRLTLTLPLPPHVKWEDRISCHVP